MINKSKAISRKLISIIVAAMMVMAVAIAAVIAISGYANLESITRQNIDRSVNVIAERIVNLSARSHSIINSINQLSEIQNLLSIESVLGPYYHEAAAGPVPIDAADQIYKLQAQLELASQLRPIMEASETYSLALYHADSFNSLAAKDPAFSLRLTNKALEVAQYTEKDRASIIASTILEGNNDTKLFDVSSIYELGLSDFLASMSVENLLAVPEAPRADLRGEIDRLIIVNNNPIIQTAAFLSISVPHPDDWVITKTNAYIVVIEQQVDESLISEFKELVNADIALLVEGELLTSTLGAEMFSYDEMLRVATTDEEFFVASKKVAFSAGMDDLREMEVLVLSPTSLVATLNLKLFIQIFMVILSGTLLVCFMFYIAIIRIINTPLTALMEGVEHLAQGELMHKINISGDDEMGRLARAFNQMSADVHEKRHQLKASHAELEQLLETQKKELESTQTQLIEAERMSSLGELVAGVSHEISTPIGICITAESFFNSETQLVQAKFNDGSMSRQDFTDYIAIALENSSILSASLSRTAVLIKNFKQIAVDQCIEDVRPIIVYRYIEDLLSTLKPRMKALKHKVIISGDESLEITSLPGAIAQIITNLIMNSIIHGFDGIEEGCISIEVAKHEHGVLLIYKDDGKGMSTQAQEKIFDPFFTTRKGKGGTGLGMNIVYKLITDTLHGYIECTSQSDQGVKFEIFIEGLNL